MENILTTIHDKLKGYRLIIVGMITTLPGLYLELYDGVKEMGIDITPLFTTFHFERWLPLFTIISGIIVILLRLDTRSPIGTYVPPVPTPLVNPVMPTIPTIPTISGTS